MHLPELPSQDELLRLQKRARTHAGRAEVPCAAPQEPVQEACRTSVSNTVSYQIQELPAPIGEVVNIAHGSMAVLPGPRDLPGTSSLEASHPISKPSLRSLIQHAATSRTRPQGNELQQYKTSPRKPGLGFFNRMTKRRWIRAVDSALDTLPMRSMLSHFSPTRFQRVSYIQVVVLLINPPAYDAWCCWMGSTGVECRRW